MKPVVDLKNIPFSRYGSFFVVSDMDNKLYIRDVRRGDLDPGIVFELAIDEAYQLSGDESELVLKYKSGMIQIIMPDLENIRLKTQGMALTLKMQANKYDNYFYNPKGYAEICSYARERRFAIHTLSGFCQLNKTDGVTIDISEAADIVIESYLVKSTYKNQLTYDQAKSVVKDDFNKWLSQMTSSNTYSSRLAAYITWSNMVHDEGVLGRYAMYMSMNWMTNIWSWDNCFGAIALASSLPSLAYDQFMFFKDLQDSSGMLPDYANTVYASYASAKPPIYGWTYRYMMKRHQLFKDQTNLREVYDFVSAFTTFWLKERSHEGLPYYTHGNESGWDNGTNYQEGVPLASPDLLAFLIDQIDFLMDIGQSLGLDIQVWHQYSESLLDKLMGLWHEGQFRAYLINEEKFVTSGDSLQNFLPILVADKLDKAISDQLFEGLFAEDRFLTDFGLATESISSPDYRYNGYWQGPIWAPTMLIFIDAIRNAGYEDQAAMIAGRFIRCMEVGGMAENFDPLTGQGLVDPSFAWTSSVYLTLVDEYSDK